MQEDLPLFKAQTVKTATTRTTTATKTQIELGAMPEKESIFSVSEVSGWVKRTIEVNFSKLHIRGEISQPKYHASGHLYCRIKDASAVIEAIAWRGVVSRLPFKIEDGMEVIATGRLTTYQGRSQYQLIIDAIELAGEGALLKCIEERKKKLAAEGLFDTAHKKPLPYMPQKIAVITSETGAVIRDILHRIQDRFPVEVLLWPTAVQGPYASSQIIEAIEGLNKLSDLPDPPPPPELIILARGGGSLEDLMAFNEEEMVRAIFKSSVPIISAIGHETDTTLVDFVSDRRAPTPTAAAEMAVPVREELLLTSRNYYQRMRVGMYRFLTERKKTIQAMRSAVTDPTILLSNLIQRRDDWSSRFTYAARGTLDRKRQHFTSLSHLLSPHFMAQQLSQKQERLSFVTRNFERSANLLHANYCQKLRRFTELLVSCSYQKTLKRGYAIVRDTQGKLLLSAKATRAQKSVELIFHDGSTHLSHK